MTSNFGSHAVRLLLLMLQVAQSVSADNATSARLDIAEEKKTLVSGPLAVSLQSLNDKYLAALDRQLAAKTLTPGDEQAVQEEKKMITKGEPVPPLDIDRTPAVLKPMRQAYRSAYATAQKQAKTALESLRRKARQQLASLNQQEKAGKAPGPAMTEAELDELLDGPKERRPFPLVGKWKVYQSKGVLDEWVVEGEGAFTGKVNHQKGWSGIDFHAGGYTIGRFPAGSDVWKIEMKGDDEFQGTDPKSSLSKIHGIRVRP